MRWHVFAYFHYLRNTQDTFRRRLTVYGYCDYSIAIMGPLAHHFTVDADNDDFLVKLRSSVLITRRLRLLGMR